MHWTQIHTHESFVISIGSTTFPRYRYTHAFIFLITRNFSPKENLPKLPYNAYAKSCILKSCLHIGANQINSTHNFNRFQLLKTKPNKGSYQISNLIESNDESLHSSRSHTWSPIAEINSHRSFPSNAQIIPPKCRVLPRRCISFQMPLPYAKTQGYVSKSQWSS